MAREQHYPQRGGILPTPQLHILAPTMPEDRKYGLSSMLQSLDDNSGLLPFYFTVRRYVKVVKILLIV